MIFSRRLSGPCSASRGRLLPGFRACRSVRKLAPGPIKRAHSDQPKGAYHIENGSAENFPYCAADAWNLVEPTHGKGPKKKECTLRCANLLFLIPPNELVWLRRLLPLSTRFVLHPGFSSYRDIMTKRFKTLDISKPMTVCYSSRTKMAALPAVKWWCRPKLR